MFKRNVRKVELDRQTGNVKVEIPDKGIYEFTTENVSLEEFFKKTGYRQNPDLVIRKAPGGVKDWNEVITQSLNEENLRSAYDKSNGMKR